MTIRYVGIGGNDGNSGLTWALRKASLNGVEDTPVAAGDTVYVGPGTYRETLTVDVSGTAGNPISYIGDYLGTNTDGVGGVVRITGSDNDQTATRGRCIDTAGTARSYRTFRGFLTDTCTGNNIAVIGTSCVNWIIDQCVFYPSTGGISLQFSGATHANHLVQNCYFANKADQVCIQLTHSSAVDNTSHLIQNCIFAYGATGIQTTRVGNITAKNCNFSTRVNGVQIATALTAGQTFTVNNSIFQCCSLAFNSVAADSTLVENYNSLFANVTDRTNTNTGANSITYPALFDSRPWFQLMYAQNPSQLVNPLDLASYSQLVNLAGTSPTTTDLRGTAVQGAQREWGALEYDATLRKQAREAALIDGGGMVVL